MLSELISELSESTLRSVYTGEGPTLYIYFILRSQVDTSFTLFQFTAQFVKTFFLVLSFFQYFVQHTAVGPYSSHEHPKKINQLF